MLEHNPMVSVVVIAYNHSRFIAETLDSIFSQNVDFPIEVIVSDDASTDGTQAILKEYLAKKNGSLHLILRKENLGPTRNAYETLMKARGKYIASLEGDDFWNSKDFLTRSVAFLEAYSSYIGYSDRCQVVDETGNIKEDLKGFWTFSDTEFGLEDFLLWKMPGHLSATVYRNIYNLYPDDYSPYYKMHATIGDRTILMYLVAHGKIFCSDEVSLSYRLVEKKTADNWMSKYKAKNRRFEEFNLICSLEEMLNEHFKMNVSMEPLRRSKLAAAAIVALQSPTLENFKALGKICRADGSFVRNTNIILSAWVQKCYWILRGQPEHRVSV